MLRLMHSLWLCVYRDMFVDPSMRPRFPQIQRGMLESLMDETDQVREM